MKRVAIVTLAALVCLSAPLTGGETKTKKHVGTWTRSANDVEVKFEIKDDNTLKCTIAGMGLTLIVDADYGVSKDGVVFGRISKVEKKGADVGPNAGDLFSFKCEVKDGTLKISDLHPAEAREIIEGDYKGKK
jgi:hypothetical protein